MRYRVEDLFVEIDDEVLAEHDGDKEPPPNDVSEWYGGDLERALEKGIAEVEHFRDSPHAGAGGGIAP